MKSVQLIQELLLPLENPSIKNLQTETQNKEYEGAIFILNGLSIRSRLAKSTPKKKGYFVAFWEKNTQGTNQAYSYNKGPDKLVIVIMDHTKHGLFIFPKEVLLQQKILRTNTQKGKMATRVYPSWEIDLNPTAMKTPKWQAPYFIDLTQEVSREKINLLY